MYGCSWKNFRPSLHCLDLENVYDPNLFGMHCANTLYQRKVYSYRSHSVSMSMFIKEAPSHLFISLFIYVLHCSCALSRGISNVLHTVLCRCFSSASPQRIQSLSVTASCQGMSNLNISDQCSQSTVLCNCITLQCSLGGVPHLAFFVRDRYGVALRKIER